MAALGVLRLLSEQSPELPVGSAVTKADDCSAAQATSGIDAAGMPTCCLVHSGEEHIFACCDFLANKHASCTPLGHTSGTGYQTRNKDSRYVSVLVSSIRPLRQLRYRALAASGTNQVVSQRKLTMHGARHVHTSAAPQTQGSRATMHTPRAVGASSSLKV